MRRVTMEVMVKFYERDFSSSESKNAYLKACKWVAKHVISKEEELGITYYRITKSNESEKPTFTLELYCSIPTAEHQESFCRACKEFHSKFYINQQFNCDKCNHNAFKKQIRQKLNIKKNYRKEKLGYITEDET